MKNPKITKIICAGMFAALSYVVFTFLQIKVPLPGGDATSFHLGNAICLLAALILGGAYGGLAGAVGMTIADLFDPIYILYAPKTFILKFLIGMICGVVAHKIGKINQSTDKKHIRKWTVLASLAAMLFNVIFDPLIGYLYKLVILGKPAATISLTYNLMTTSVNALLSVIASVLIYMSIRPVLIRMNLIAPVNADDESVKR